MKGPRSNFSEEGATKQGYFITFEGGEGTGKSSQVQRLINRLRQKNLPVTQTREPDGPAQAELIRQLLVTHKAEGWDSLTEALLQFAARRENYCQRILPALKSKEWVISDRFFDSTFAYQGAGQGVSESTLHQLCQLTLGNFKPDLTLVLDIPVEIGLKRSYGRLKAAASEENRFEEMGLAFHERIRQAFQEIVQKNPDRCVLIDTRPSLEEVEENIWAVLKQRGLLPL